MSAYNLHRFGMALLVIGALSVFAQEPNAVAIETVRKLKGADLSANPALKRAVDKVVDDVRGRAVMVELIRDFDLRDRVPDMVAYLRKHPAEDAALEAVQYLAAIDPKALSEDLQPKVGSAELIGTIGRSGRTEWNLDLVRIASSTEASLGAREASVHALLSTESGAEAVVRVVASKGLPESLMRNAVQGLQAARWPKVRELASKFSAILPTSKGEAQVPKERILQMAGDARRGALVFRRAGTGCIGCHQVGREGVEFGPNLGEIGAKLGKEALYDAIVDPGAGISFGYEAWLLTLKDGDEVIGLIASETDLEVALRVPGGQILRYRKTDVLKRDKQAGSIMPGGLQETMVPQEFADLLAYLSSLKPGNP